LVVVVGHVTFSQFVQYVVDEWSSGRALDRHWRPQHEICNPCYVKYDFIGRFEDFSVDVKHVLAILNASNVMIPNSNSFKNVPLSQERTRFYADVPHVLVRKLIQLYKVDYELFDYDYRWACDDC